MKPHVLPPNVLRHFYAGGARIAALRGIELDSDHMPEEWLGAASTTFGDDVRGLSRLEDGTFVRDAIAAEMAYLRLDGDDRAPQRRTIECTVVARGSGELPAP